MPWLTVKRHEHLTENCSIHALFLSHTSSSGRKKLKIKFKIYIAFLNFEHSYMFWYVSLGHFVLFGCSNNWLWAQKSGYWGTVLYNPATIQWCSTRQQMSDNVSKCHKCTKLLWQNCPVRYPTIFCGQSPILLMMICMLYDTTTISQWDALMCRTLSFYPKIRE